jgi:polysaccharide deacetylase 2 family uncharacterized protein YibQ
MPRGKVSAKYRKRARKAPSKKATPLLSRRNLLLAGGAVMTAGVFARLAERMGGQHPAPISESASIGDLIASLPPDTPQDPLRSAPLMEEEPLPHDVFIPDTTQKQAASAAIGNQLPVTDVPTAPVQAPPVSQSLAVPASPTQRAIATAAPRWLDNARPLVQSGGRPAIAIVIDDLGLQTDLTRQVLALDSNVTLAFMTYAQQLPEWVGRARQGRHEFLVHVPMQPISPTVDPGPNALTVGLRDDEIRARLNWGLDRLEGYVGANNHMGSRFTEDAAGMRIVLAEVKARGLLFLDSRTTGNSVCGPIAAALNLPFAQRNVFLDDEPTESGVRQQIAVLESVARRHGTAIGIGHPHPATIDVLAQWLPTASTRGVAVLPLTSIMRLAAERA